MNAKPQLHEVCVYTQMMQPDVFPGVKLEYRYVLLRVQPSKINIIEGADGMPTHWHRNTSAPSSKISLESQINVQTLHDIFHTVKTWHYCCL